MISRSRLLVIVFGAGLLCQPVCSSAYSADPAEATAKPSPPLPPTENVIIPGPLRSFLRMAGISQKATPSDVLPLLAHNVFIEGYGDGQQTEFLTLLDRYVHQARELEALAGDNSTIHVEHCADAANLLHILGYQLRKGCGQKNDYLLTANPERAFLTIDSGFPLTALEEALQQGTPFVYQYPSSRVPVLFHESDWIALSDGKRADSGNLINVLLHEPSVARLYWSMTKIDSDTRLELQRAPGLRKLLPYGPVLDFYGGEINISAGQVVVPGGPTSESSWKDLVGANPKSPGDFVFHLLSKDNGWLAAYFDVLSRVSQDQQTHLTQSPRMKRLYESFRDSDPQSSATKGVFRKAPELLVLFSRVQWDANGAPHVPGNLEVWKQIVNQKTDSKTIRDWAKHARNWDTPEQLLEAMTAFSRLQTDTGPLQVYIMLNELDSRRAAQDRLSPETVRLLADKFSLLNSWYLVFSEFPELNGASIARFLTVADAVDKTQNQSLRGNVQGAFQASLGLWQILARQGQIPGSEQNSSWQNVIGPFAKVDSPTRLFDAAHDSLKAILLSAGVSQKIFQDQLIDLLAGPPQQSPDGQRTHAQIADRIRSVMNDQRLVSLDTLIGLSDGLNAMAHGAARSDSLVALSAELRDFELPRPIFTNNEKIIWSPNIYNTHHAELQVRTDLAKVIKGPSTRAQYEAARGQLAPFLRDTLVGLNYAYYEPPGAQMLHNNPLFVRAHDFTGATIRGADRLWGVSELVGAGSPADGGGYLMGSLADLPYALASAEQDFISPENVQALIWVELVPELLANATLSRWWNVSPNELHAVTLYQKSGEELLTKSLGDDHLRGEVTRILSDRIVPQGLEWTARPSPGDKAAILSRMGPADTFYLAVEFRKRYPAEAASSGPAGQQLEELSRQHPDEVSWGQTIRKISASRTQSWPEARPRELLNVKPLPFFVAIQAASSANRGTPAICTGPVWRMKWVIHP